LISESSTSAPSSSLSAFPTLSSGAFHSSCAFHCLRGALSSVG
jgi:hypothetical protein